MIAFEVYLNGKKLCVAGIGNEGVMTAIVDWVGRPEGASSELSVSGLISPAREHVKWVDRKLRVGDQIRVKVVNKTSVDEPRKRYRRDPEKELEYQKQYLRRLAKQFGWKIQAGRQN